MVCLICYWWREGLHPAGAGQAIAGIHFIIFGWEVALAFFFYEIHIKNMFLKFLKM